VELRSEGWLISKNKEGKRGNIWKPDVRSHMTARDHRGEIPTTLVVVIVIGTTRKSNIKTKSFEFIYYNYKKDKGKVNFIVYYYKDNILK
jgi:hypothetical protein